MSALSEQRQREREGRAGICKSNRILAVMNSLPGHPQSSKEIIACNRSKIANGPRARWSVQ